MSENPTNQNKEASYENSVLQNLYYERQFLINQLTHENSQSKVAQINYEKIASLQKKISKLNQQISFLEDVLVNGLSGNNSSNNSPTQLKLLKEIGPDSTERGKNKYHTISKNSFYNSLNQTNSDGSKTFIPNIGISKRYSGMKMNTSKPKSTSKTEIKDNDAEFEGLSME